MYSSNEVCLKEVFSLLIRSTSIPALIREILCRNKATIISYHNPDPDIFKAHLKYLTRHYNIISLDRLVSAIKSEYSWESLPKKSLVITMDDGFSGNYNLIPVLDEFRVAVTIFIRQDEIKSARPRNERRYLNRKEMLELLGHHVSFGAHSMTHPHLSELSDESACYEINESKNYLERELPIQIKHFAYPYGDYGKREVRILKSGSQYASARTIKPGWIDEKTDPYSLKCMAIGDEARINKMVLDVTGIFPFFRTVRMRFYKSRFNKYKPLFSYITGILNLRGPIGQHTPQQAELIKKYAKDRKRLVEIGVGEGVSSLIALSVMDPNGKMWLIDPYRSIFYPFFSLSQKIAKRALVKFKNRDIIFLRDYSYNIIKTWNIKFDYLLWDACHSEEKFMRDWNAWSPFLDDDGVVLVQSTQSTQGLSTGAGKVLKRLLKDPDSQWVMIDSRDATIVIKRKK